MFETNASPQLLPLLAPGDRYVGLAEASALGFGCNSALRGRIARGELPATKIGRKYSVKLSDLERLRRPVDVLPDDEDVAAAVGVVEAAGDRLTPEHVRRLAAFVGGASE